MKNIFLSVLLFTALSANANVTTILLKGEEAQRKISNSEVVRMKRFSAIPNYIQFKKGAELPLAGLENWLQHYFKAHQKVGLTLIKKEKDDLGIYKAAYVYFSGNTVENVEGALVKLYRGGTDESTFGPILDLTNSSFENVGHDKRNKYGAAVSIFGVQLAEMYDLEFKDSKKLYMLLATGLI